MAFIESFIAESFISENIFAAHLVINLIFAHPLGQQILLLQSQCSGAVDGYVDNISSCWYFFFKNRSIRWRGWLLVLGRVRPNYYSLGGLKQLESARDATRTTYAQLISTIHLAKQIHLNHSQLMETCGSVCVPASCAYAKRSRRKTLACSMRSCLAQACVSEKWWAHPMASPNSSFRCFPSMLSFFTPSLPWQHHKSIL